MRDVEHRLQCACVKRFRMQYPEYARLLFSIPNGWARDAITGRRMKEEGVVAGVADMFLAMPCGQRHGLLIEMKTGKGVQSNPQKELAELIGSSPQEINAFLRGRQVISFEKLERIFKVLGL